MFRILKERLKQKYRTSNYPDAPPSLPTHHLGVPTLRAADCGDCDACRRVCPSGAIAPLPDGAGPQLDMGRCIFCGACQDACPHQAIIFGYDHRVAAFRRSQLIVDAEHPFRGPGEIARDDIARLFSRSMVLREVSAGGCGACEADTNVLGTLVYDLGRFGISFAASPRHADGVLVTGPVSENMRLALLDTHAAVAEPRIVIAVGTCAISGGLFAGSGECCGGVTDLLPVDLFIPGCPPSPWSILDGLLAISGRNRKD